MKGFTRKKTKGGVGRVDVIKRERLGFAKIFFIYIFLFVYISERIIYNAILGTGEGHKFSTVYK